MIGYQCCKEKIPHVHVVGYQSISPKINLRDHRLFIEVLLGGPLDELANLKTNGGKHGQQFFVGFLNIPVEKFNDTNNFGPRFYREGESGMEAFSCGSSRARKIRVGNHISDP